MKDLNIILRYFSYMRIDKFNTLKIKKYPQINYKHYIRLPKYWLKNKLTLNKTSNFLWNLLKRRRSIRNFREKNITIDQLNYILTASLGVNDSKKRYRTYPSAGALYTVECYVLLLKSTDSLAKGIYHYNFLLNSLELVNSDINKKTAKLIFTDCAFKNASVFAILTGIPNRSIWKYKVKTLAFMYIEAGHIGQNIYLSSLAQKIGCCALGGFIDKNVIRFLKIRKDYEYPLYAFALGSKDNKLDKK